MKGSINTLKRHYLAVLCFCQVTRASSLRAWEDLCPTPSKNDEKALLRNPEKTDL